MSAIVITASYLLNRIGGPDEMNKDRKHCTALLNWSFNYQWREAELAGDTDRMGYLARQKENWECL